MNKLIAMLLAIVMVVCLFAGCSNTTEEPTPTNGGSETTTTQPDPAPKADFSANVNVNRASDYAATEMPLPVEGIGRGISTDIVGASIQAYINALNKIVYEEAEA